MLILDKMAEEDSMKQLTRVAAGAGIALVLWAGMAPSSKGAQQGSAARERSKALEEVVVTARRTEENLQAVPASISAFTETALDNVRVDDLGDLQAYVPNLSLHVGDASNAVIYLRGVGQIDALAFSDPGVGVYVDDVYLGRAQGSFLDVMDVERVEVLRGPQGTLYGRNTIGGAVKYVSAKPGDSFSAKFDATMGNYGKTDAKASLGGPLSDTLKAQVSLASLRRDGYAGNRFDGEDDGDKDTFAWRALLLFEPFDSLSAQLTLDRSDADPNRSRTPAKETPCCTISALTGTAPEMPADTDPFSLDVSFNTVERTQSEGVSLLVDYGLGDSLTLKYIGSQRELAYNGELDLDGTRHRIFDVFFNLDQEQTTHELQLTLDLPTSTLVAGLYQFEEESISFDGIIGPSLAFLPDAGLDVFVFSGLNENRSEGLALYADYTYQFSDQWAASIGARQSAEEKEFERLVDFFPSSMLPAAPNAITQATLATGKGIRTTTLNVPDTNDLDNEWDNLSMKASLDFQHTSDIMYYLSVSEGFKSGGFNGRSNNEFEAEPYDEENLLAFEAGVKSRLLDGRLLLNAAAFRNEYEDFQVQIFAADPMGNFVGVFQNAGEATINGFEVDAQALLTDKLSLTGSIGHLDASYDEFIDGGVDVAKERELVNAPEWDLALGLELDMPVAGGTVTLSSYLNRRSETFLTVSSSKTLAQDDYTLVNASLRYVTTDGNLSIIAYGKNLTDERYRNHGFDLAAYPGVELGYYGAPKTYALSLIYRL